MALEIERKFLVRGDAWRGLAEPVRMRQGYVPAENHVTVRVRTAGEKAWITLKTPAKDLVRQEFEYEIPLADANAMLDSMCGCVVEKNRYRIPAAEPGLAWEVDEFLGDNAPLITAEIELPNAEFVVKLPEWVGLEVTDDNRYKNNRLAERPYSTWR
jgi:CYTH domain-containing protein